MIKINTIRSTIWGFLFLLCGTSLWGQSVPQTFRIMTSVGPVKELKYDDGSDTINLDIRSSISREYEVPSRGIELYRMIEPPEGSDPSLQPKKEIVARVNVPASMSQVLLVLLYDSQKRYQVLLFEDSFEQHPAGQLRLINVSGMSAAMNLKNKNYQVEPGKSALVPYESGPKRVKVAVQGGDKWKMAFNKGRIARPGLRAYVIIFNYEPDPSLHDIPPPPALVRFTTQAVPVEENQ